MKRISFLIIGLAIIALTAVSYTRLQGSQDLSTRESETSGAIALASFGDMRQVVETTGSIEANLEVEVKSKASGQITSLPVDLSDRVKKGDLLVELDPIDEERSVMTARVSLDAAKARLAQARLTYQMAQHSMTTEERRARADLVSASAKAVESKSKFERSKELLLSKVVSQEEFESSRTESAQSQATLEDAKARVSDLTAQKMNLSAKEQDIEIAKTQVATAEIALAMAERRLSETKILAPIDGVVTSRDAQLGQIVSSGISNVGGGSALVTLADLSRSFVVANVDESDIGKIRVGQLAEITADAFPKKKFSGRVVRVASKGQLTSNVVTFVVKIEVEGEGVALLKPEMTSNVTIITAQRRNILRIPALAVNHKRDETFVQCLLPNGKTEERRIQIGIADLQYAEVTEGLKANDKVIVPSATQVSQWRSQRQAQRSEHMKERLQSSMMGSKGPGR